MEGGFFDAASEMCLARLYLAFHLAGHLFDLGMEAFVFFWQGEAKFVSLYLGACLNVPGGLIEGNFNMDVVILDFRMRVDFVIGNSMVDLRGNRLGMLNSLRRLDFTGRVMFAIRSSFVKLGGERQGMANFLSSTDLNRRTEPRSRNRRDILWELLYSW